MMPPAPPDLPGLAPGFSRPDTPLVLDTPVIKVRCDCDGEAAVGYD
jgi:hypothetical protein